MATTLPDIKTQDSLDVDEIADVLHLCDKTHPNPMEIRLINHRIYRGVMVMEIMILASAESKRVKLYTVHRVVLLGQVLEDEGSMICMELDREHIQGANVTAGLAMKDFDIERTHWCSGLAIQQVYKTTAVATQPRALPKKTSRMPERT